MTEHQRKLLDAVTYLCERPAKHVPFVSVTAVTTYLRGVDHGCMLAGLDPPFGQFFGWAMMKCDVHSEAFELARCLWHKYGTERAALQAIPALLREYFDVLEVRSAEQVDAEIDAWVRSKTTARYAAINTRDAEAIAAALHDGWDGPPSHTISIGRLYSDLKQRGIIPE